MNSKNLNILVTCVGGDNGVEIINQIKTNKFVKRTKIVGIDIKKNVVAKKFLDFYYKISNTPKNNYIKSLEKIVKMHKINIILALSDEESLTLSKHFQLNKQVKVATSSYHTLKILSNKIKTYEILEKNKIKLPKWKPINKEKDFESSIKYFEKIKKNFCVKPSVSRGGRDVYVINNKIKNILSFQNSREKHLSLKKFKKNYKSFFSKKNYPLIMMERLKPPVYDLDLLAKNGKLVTCAFRKRIHSALPNKGHLIIKKKKLVELGKRLCKIFNLNYLHDCDLMQNEKNEFMILEINPRPSGSFVVAEVAGYPIIENMIKIYKNVKNFRKPSLIFNKVIPYQSLTNY